MSANSPRDYLLRRCQMLDRSVQNAMRWRAEARAEWEKAEDICAELRASGRELSDYVHRRLADARLQYDEAVKLVDRETLKQSEAWFNLEDYDNRALAAAGAPPLDHAQMTTEKAN